jgi:mevalonate kinase
MLLGEHAVLYGQPAMSCAINKFIKVKLIPRHDQQVIIKSALGFYNTRLNNLTVKPPFTFILAVLQRYQAYLLNGLELQVDSDCSANLGLGSSAAIVAATLAALRTWLKQPTDLSILFAEGLAAIHAVQGVGSGADLAASLYGGVVYFEANKQPKRINIKLPIVLIYSGYKTPTVEVIKRIQAERIQQPSLFAAIEAAIGQCSRAGYRALKHEDWQTLGKILTIQQGLMQALNVSDTVLNCIVNELLACTEIYGAKISGSGLGDCVLGLGEIPANYFYLPRFAQTDQRQGIQQIDITVSCQGLSCKQVK